jgi:phosphohistidine phosphatase SixA
VRGIPARYLQTRNDGGENDARSLLHPDAFFAAGPVAGQDDWAALRPDGAIALMRHALAPGTGDPPGFRLDDCSTQCNLDAAGRAQARRIGAELRSRDIAFDRVWTSQWCRCGETAELLAVGAVVEKPFLNSFFGDRSEGSQRTRALRDTLATLPEGGRPIVVTHQVKTTALTGGFVQSGKIVVVEQDTDGSIVVTGRIRVAP